VRTRAGSEPARAALGGGAPGRKRGAKVVALYGDVVGGRAGQEGGNGTVEGVVGKVK